MNTQTRAEIIAKCKEEVVFTSGSTESLNMIATGFFGNAILSILLTILGQKLNVDIYLAAIVVFVWRMFMNLGTIRRYYVEKWSNKLKNRKKFLIS